MKNKNQFYKIHRGVMNYDLSVVNYPPPSKFLTHTRCFIRCLAITTLLFLASLLLASCGAIAGHFEERTPDSANINGFNINIRSSGGAGSGAGSRASAVDFSTATNWDSEVAFNQAVSRFRVQIGDEPLRTIKLGDTITSQKRYSPGANVTVTYTAEADVTYTSTTPNENATQTRTMLIARETKEIKVGAAASTQVAFRIRDTITQSPKPNYTGYKVKLLKLAKPTNGSSRGTSDEGEFVYVQKDDPLSEYFVGNFNYVFNNMYGFSGKLETFAEWVGKEYLVKQTDIDNGFIDCNELLKDGFLVAGVSLDIDNNYYLQELTDWELIKLYGVDFKRATNGDGLKIEGKYYKLAQFSAADKPAYKYITLTASKTDESFDVKNKFGAPDVLTNGLKLDNTYALKFTDDTNPYDDAVNGVVGPYFSQANYNNGTQLDQPVQSILDLMQDGGKRQMLVYRPETVEVTFNYSGLTSQQYWKNSSTANKKISVPKNTVITKDDIAKLVKAEAKDDYEISYTGDDVTVGTGATQTITIDAVKVSATRLCKVTIKYGYTGQLFGSEGISDTDIKVKEKNIYVLENKVINDEILDFLNTTVEATRAEYVNGVIQARYTANVYYKWDTTKNQNIVANEGAIIGIAEGRSQPSIRYEDSNGNKIGDDINCIIRARHIKVKVDKTYYMLLDLNKKTLTKVAYTSSEKSKLKDFEEKFTKPFNVNDNSGPELEPARFGAPEKIGSAEFLQATDVDFYNKTNGAYKTFWEDMENGVPVNHVYSVDYARDAYHDKTVYLTYYVYTPTTNKTITTNTGKIKLWEIAGGKVPLTETYKPTVSSFYMAETEITQGQWKAVMNNDGFDTDANRRPNVTLGVGDNKPMYYVNWFDAVIFCNELSKKEGKTPCYYYGNDKNATDYTKWEDGDDKGKIPNLRYDENGSLDASANVNYEKWNKNIHCNWEANGYRLPTEAEWEYAARGGSANLFKKYSGTPGKSDEDLSKVAWHNGNTGTNSGTSGDPTAGLGSSSSAFKEVKTLSGNKNRIKDMNGNVDEWCWDWLGDYDVSVATDPKGIAYNENAGRVRRGGSIRSYAENCNVTWRANYPMSHRSWSMGLRVVCRQP